MLKINSVMAEHCPAVIESLTGNIDFIDTYILLGMGVNIHIACDYNRTVRRVFVNVGGELFILRVRGESMIQAGIMNDDYIVVHRQMNANNGEIVVAMIDDEATVKRFYKENGHIRLQPENDAMEPIIVPEVMILGKVVSLIRKF